MTRRTLISAVTTLLRARGTRKTFDPDYGSAIDAAVAIRGRTISSVELTKHVFERIDRLQPKLNTFVYQTREQALARARLADEAVARRDARLPPLAGVPVVVKESFGIAGRPYTWGFPALKNSLAPENSTCVQRLVEAGTIIVGATNVPFELTDGQSYNELYGTTNNPWDLTRTPGWSSGGTAAALAAGMGFLGVGSDLAGSIRSPANCCGIFGHKLTLDVLSLRGQTPGGALAEPGVSTLLAAAGPLARTAEDLELALHVLGGLEIPDSVAYTWRLPEARHERLGEFRIGYVLEYPLMPVSSEIRPALESAVQTLQKGGARMQPGWPSSFSFKDMFSTYLVMLTAFNFSITPPAAQAHQRTEFASTEKDGERARASLNRVRKLASLQPA